MLQESATVLQSFFDLALWGALALVARLAYKEPYRMHPAIRFMSCFLILIFCLFPFWGGDYFHYNQAFYDYNHGGNLTQEPLYGWLYSTFSFSYTAWRFVVWGGALFLLFRAYKRCSENYDLCLFFFGALYVHWFSYARASLAMSFILFGLAFLSMAKTNATMFSRINSCLLGLASLVVAFFFHKSALLGIGAAVASLFLLNATRRTILLIAVMIPVMVFALQWGLDYFAEMELSQDTIITAHYRDRFVNLGEMSGVYRMSLGPFLEQLLAKLPLYFNVVLYIISLYIGLYNRFSLGERAFASYVFIITLMSIGIDFTEGYATRVLQYRTLFFAMPANGVFLSAVRRNGYDRVPYQIVFWGGLLGSAYCMTYAVWCSLAR